MFVREKGLSGDPQEGEGDTRGALAVRRLEGPPARGAPGDDALAGDEERLADFNIFFVYTPQSKN